MHVLIVSKSGTKCYYVIEVFYITIFGNEILQRIFIRIYID